MKNQFTRIAAFGVCLAIFINFIAAPTAAQEKKPPVVEGMEIVNAPISAEVKPAATLAGLPVKISGLTEFDGSRFDVKITVTSPRGAPVTLAAKINDAGKFEIAFADTGATGKYLLKIVAPDGKGTADAAFEVLEPAEAFARPAAAASDLLAATTEAATLTEELIETLPPSPPKEELAAKIGELKENLAQSPANVGKFGNALARLAEIVGRYPETAPAFADFIENLDAQIVKVRENTGSLRGRLARSRRDGVRCDKLDTANEAFNAISFALNLNSNLFDLAKNFAIDKGTPRALAAAAERSGRTPGAAANLFISDTLKFSVAVLTGGAPSPVGWAMAGIGVINDIAQFQTQKIFDQYCERFEGPLVATYDIKYINNLELFWSYQITFKGKLSLRYAKPSEPNEAVQFTGQLEGNATKIDVQENFIQLNPKLRRFLLFRRAYAPPTVPYVEDFGAFARMATPGYFRIPVEGELSNGKLSLKFKPATNDFSSVYRGKALYIFVITAVPLITVVDLPIQPAAFILVNGMSKNPTFDVALDATKKNRSIARAFTREYRDPKGEFNITWKVNVKACNPGCLNNEIIER